MVHLPPMTAGRYLIRRLEQLGLKHIFGVPGDYVLKFLDLIEESNIDLVTTCNELNAGYAGDAYARTAGLGAVCVTYGVGGFSVYNAVAGSFAERVPLVVISGGPSLSLRGRLHPYLLHHTIGDMNLQRDIFEKITQAAVVLSNPAQAPSQIDETLAACLRYSRPVYIEIPADMVTQASSEPRRGIRLRQNSCSSGISTVTVFSRPRKRNESMPDHFRSPTATGFSISSSTPRPWTIRNPWPSMT